MVGNGRVLLVKAGIVALAVGYFLLPVDFVPEALFPVVGFVDDVVIGLLAYQLTKKVK